MPDFLGLMKQATELKSKMENMQAELDRLEVEGTAGSGMLTLTMSGKGELRHAKVDESLLKPDQKEIIEDLMVAAHADARRKLFDFIADCEKDGTAQVNVFAYDLDEPDIVAAICRPACSLSARPRRCRLMKFPRRA